MEISSPSNPRLKQVRALLDRRRERARSGLFVAEGEDLVAAATAAGWTPEALLVAADAVVELPAHGIDPATATTVAPALLAAASSLGSGTRVLAIYRQRLADAPVGPRCLHLHGVRDPGNVGTAIRAAHALGASSVALGPGTADPYGPKAVRASMGSLFALPLARAAGPDELPGTTVALALRRGAVLRADAEWLETALAGDGVSLLVGAEREGLPDDLVDRCDHVAHLPIDGAESLNAAMAATVALYELARGAA
ncbi:TrmH family RNA methyltransferase [Patulibacter defluvii]|uniref:TrmH family RNA methyltransferase n=1 Tax=Patulibacter defluvii TaxID=3095358 RepID=UPI002A74D0FC|nr:RNA methyltransferase [Patulibacter sp. DM4]